MRTSACIAIATFLADRNRPYRIIEPLMSSSTTVEQLVDAFVEMQFEIAARRT